MATMTTVRPVEPASPADPPTRPGWVPDDLYPFEDRWADVDGNLVHFIDEGDGPVLLFLNGNPSWSFGWRDVVLRLRDRFRCIAPDHPGFGLSQARVGYDLRPASHAAVLEGLIDQLGLTGITLVAYDWGGPIGLWVAGRRPDRFRALVLGNTWGWPMESRAMRLFSALVGGPLGPLLVDRLDVMLRVFLPRSLRRAPLTPAEVEAYAGPFQGADRRAMRILPRELTTGRAFQRDVERGLAGLRDHPALLIWGDGSTGLGQAELDRWRSTLPRAQVVELTRVGRYLDEDAPDEVADAIERWWRTAVEPDDRPGSTGGWT
jgi:haloalkane dehalogenase